jgi:type VI secretion system protein
VAAVPCSVNIHFGSTYPLKSRRCPDRNRILLYLRGGSCSKGSTLNARRHLALSTLALASLLTGCALKHPGKSLKQAVGHPPTLALQVNVAADANVDSVVPFDVAVVRDKKLLKQISELDAATWFSPKGRCNYRGDAKAKVQFYSWELVPGQTFRLDVPVTADTRAVLGFADYSTPGDHRIALASAGAQFVDMRENGVHVLTTVPVPKTDEPPASVKQNVCSDD